VTALNPGEMSTPVKIRLLIDDVVMRARQLFEVSDRDVLYRAMEES